MLDGSYANPCGRRPAAPKPLANRIARRKCKHGKTDLGDATTLSRRPKIKLPALKGKKVLTCQHLRRLDTVMAFLGKASTSIPFEFNTVW